jgi:hypothetical protein
MTMRCHNARASTAHRPLKHVRFAGAAVCLGFASICGLLPSAAAAVTAPSQSCVATADNGTACGPFDLAAGAAPITSNYLTLSMEIAGNLVLYRSPGRQLLWQSNTRGACSGKCTAVFQADGNLVLYKNGSTAYWNTATYGNSGAQLVLAPAPPYLSIRTTTPKKQPFLLFGKTSRQNYLPGQILWAAGQSLNWLAPIDPFGGYGANRPGAPDYMQLFQPGAPGWPIAFSHINVFKLYTQNFIYFQNHPPRDLKTIVDFLKANNIALAIEAQSLTCPNLRGSEGVGVASGPEQASAIAALIKSLGGTIAYAAMDEPVSLFKGLSAQGRLSACPFDSLQTLAVNVANFYAAYQAVFPAIQVGDIEFGLTGTEMAAWAAAYRNATGVPLAFFHDDAFQVGWGKNTAAVQSALKAAEGLIGPGIPYGLIRNSGQPPGTSDRAWVIKAKSNMELYDSLGLEAPSQNIFQTWEPSPTHVLPERGDTLTNVVARFFDYQALPLPPRVAAP